MYHHCTDTLQFIIANEYLKLHRLVKLVENESPDVMSSGRNVAFVKGWVSAAHIESPGIQSTSKQVHVVLLGVAKSDKSPALMYETGSKLCTEKTRLYSTSGWA